MWYSAVVTIDPDVLALAEDLNVNLPPSAGETRVVEARFAVVLGGGDHPAMNVVQRLRLADHELATAVADVRDLLRAHGRTAATWEVGSSATPERLVERLA